MSLATGKRIHYHQWEVCNVSDDVIARVHQLALAEKQPLITDNFMFEWRVEGEEIEYAAENEEEDNIDELLHVEERSAPSLLSIEDSDDELVNEETGEDVSAVNDEQYDGEYEDWENDLIIEENNDNDDLERTPLGNGDEGDSDDESE